VDVENADVLRVTDAGQQSSGLRVGVGIVNVHEGDTRHGYASFS